MKQNIAVIGLSVMGRNLAWNIADHNYRVSVFNRTKAVTEEMMALYPHKNICPYDSLESLVASLEKPRKIILMVKAGAAVDQLMEQFLPYLEEGDIVIDGGNSFYQDTQRRYEYYKSKALHYFGVGISGGEEGARKGPAIMPGGDEKAYAHIQRILEDIAAKVNGNPCCSYTSTGGAGHYVKMVHNGIEYGDMQMISEAYLLLKHLGNFSNQELHEIFNSWNQEELESYLIEISSKIFQVQEADGSYLVDKILDKASQKGTGKWTNEEAIRLGVDVSVITAALNGRFISNEKEEREKAAKLFPKAEYRVLEEKQAFVDKVKRSLLLSKVISYAQGFKLLKLAAKEYAWDFDYAKIAKIFRGGCIIQAKILQNIIEAYEKNPKLENLIFDPFFAKLIEENMESLREVSILAIQNRLPHPAMSAALSYLDSYSMAESGANLIQAQRDYFGAHTFERKDQEGIFHYDWVGHHGK